jgi:hypothetical protein
MLDDHREHVIDVTLDACVRNRLIWYRNRGQVSPRPILREALGITGLADQESK